MVVASILWEPWRLLVEHSALVIGIVTAGVGLVPTFIEVKHLRCAKKTAFVLLVLAMAAANWGLGAAPPKELRELRETQGFTVGFQNLKSHLLGDIDKQLNKKVYFEDWQAWLRSLTKLHADVEKSIDEERPEFLVLSPEELDELREGLNQLKVAIEDGREISQPARNEPIERLKGELQSLREIVARVSSNAFWAFMDERGKSDAN